VLRNDKNHQLVIHRKCPGARISLMQNVESEEWNIIKVHRSQINILVVPKAIKTPDAGRGEDEETRDTVWF